LWCAVRRGRRDHTVALLEAGADPWRTVFGGRSAGRIALDGPLADLFEHLPGAPVLSEEERRLQRDADGLIGGYDSWLRDPQTIMAIAEPWARKVMGVWEVFCVAFVKGPDEEEVIRRMGVDAEACSILSLEEYQGRCSDAWEANRDASGWVRSTPEEAWLWVSTAPSGGVMVFHGDGILPINEPFCSRITAGGGLSASVFHHGEVSVHIWRDGNREGWPSPHHDPWPGCPDEAWRCRFGDAAHESGALARSLALMTVLTGVHVEPKWFVTAPKRAVRMSEPPI
jgi:hypothetical protein